MSPLSGDDNHLHGGPAEDHRHHGLQGGRAHPGVQGSAQDGTELQVRYVVDLLIVTMSVTYTKAIARVVTVVKRLDLGIWFK